MIRRSVAVLLLLTAWLAAGQALAEDGPFPRVEAIEANVDFWEDVFGTWSMGQVVVHDTRYPGLRYEVATLPGKVSDRYTDRQREFIDFLNEAWEKKLRRLEDRVRRGRRLSAGDRELVQRIRAHGGEKALKGAHERVRSQRGLRERFRRGLEISGRYDSALRKIFRDRGLPEDLAYLPHVESSFQARARSSAGAVGVWQFTRGTGRQYMRINSAIDERLDPIVAGEAAARYLGNAYDKLGNWALAITSYNHGVAGMQRAVRAHGRDFGKIYKNYRSRTFGFASSNFYAEFLAARRLARNPDAKFPGLRRETPMNLRRVRLEHPASPGGLARGWGVPLRELAAVNPAWSSRALDRGLPIPAGTRVWIPASVGDRALTMPAAESVYVVRRGDTLSEIAERHGMSLSQLRTINRVRGNKILVGQKLRVQGGSAAEPLVHVVRRGENLTLIAKRYGLSLGQIRQLNGIKDRRGRIHPGQKLQVGTGIPGRIEHHVVKRGESLIKIASAYGVRLGDLLRHNKLSRRSVIHPGQKIRIPVSR